MTDFNNAINRLEKFSRTINQAIVGTAIIEAIFVILISVAAGNLNTDSKTVNNISLWAAGSW